MTSEASCPSCGLSTTGYAEGPTSPETPTLQAAEPQPRRVTTLVPCGCQFWPDTNGNAIEVTYAEDGTAVLTALGPIQPVI